MQVKYIVHYQKGQDIPVVDIWKTEKDQPHFWYIHDHKISPRDVSSAGYLAFNPLTKKWLLEHYQLDQNDSAISLADIIENYKKKVRDRLLVRRAIHRTPFLREPQLRKKCQRVSFFRRIFQND